MMSDVTLLITKLGQLTDDDRTMLRSAGIVVLEVQRPEEVRFIKANAELSGTEMFIAAMKAIKGNGESGGDAPKRFALAIANAMLSKEPTS